MRLLTDRHQADLFYGIQRLFTDRLGWDVYTPIGHDWWDAGIWRFGEAYGDDRLVQQYLSIGPGWREVEPGQYVTFDPCHPERPLYGVTLACARGWSWDGVMATVQENQTGFARFALETGARYLYQVGNTRQQIDWALDPLVLNASEAALQGRGVAIGQEFDHRTAFRFLPPEHTNRVASFVNLLPLIHDDAGRKVSWIPFVELSKLLPDFRFRSFGHSCPDGLLQPVAHIADEMARTGWAYHDKPTGDGFGHVVHNWAAVGRPLVGHARYYAGQKAEVFWQDGATCIDLDRHSYGEAAALMRETTPERHAKMCRAIRETLDRVYDPGRDAGLVAGLLE